MVSWGFVITEEQEMTCVLCQEEIMGAYWHNEHALAVCPVCWEEIRAAAAIIGRADLQSTPLTLGGVTKMMWDDPEDDLP